MTKEFKEAYQMAADGWLAQISVCNVFIKSSDDKDWWGVRKRQCEASYDFCMLRATTPLNNAIPIPKDEFKEKYEAIINQQLLTQQN